MATDQEKVENFAFSYQADKNTKRHSYEFPTDDLATISSAGYFNAVRDNGAPLQIGDQMNVKGSDDDGLFKITALTPDVILTVLALIGGGEPRMAPRPYGSIVMSVSDNPMNVTISPAVMVGTTQLLTSNQFDMPQDGRLRYIGSVTTNFTIHATASIQADGSSSGNLVQFFIDLNGTSIDSPQAHSLKFSLDLMNVALVSTVSLGQNNFIELSLNTPTGPFNIKTFFMNIVITQAD